MAGHIRLQNVLVSMERTESRLDGSAATVSFGTAES